MATNLTRFEIVLPNTDFGTPQQTAINNFINSMLSLCQLVMYSAYIYPINGSASNFNGQNVLYGLLTTAQQATALNNLNTLNAALGYNVLCTVNQVTQEP